MMIYYHFIQKWLFYKNIFCKKNGHTLNVAGELSLCLY